MRANLKEVKSNREWREECESLRKQIEIMKLYKVGTVKFLRTGGNAGLAWYVQPCINAPMPNDGDIVYVGANTTAT